MKFSIITVFPEIFDSYLNESILKRAIADKKISITTHNPRDVVRDKHRTVDDKPYGGGAGMVLMAEPILRAAEKATAGRIKKGTHAKKTKVIILSAKGKQFTQKMAYGWAKTYDNIVMISGRYEGIDERVKTILRAEEISIGPYVLTDGDVAAMVVISSVARLVPGVINVASLEEESHGDLLRKKEQNAQETTREYPHYTRPEVLEYKGKKYRVPKVLLSGDHKKIADWRAKKRT